MWSGPSQGHCAFAQGSRQTSTEVEKSVIWTARSKLSVGGLVRHRVWNGMVLQLLPRGGASFSSTACSLPRCVTIEGLVLCFWLMVPFLFVVLQYPPSSLLDPLISNWIVSNVHIHNVLQPYVQTFAAWKHCKAQVKVSNYHLNFKNALFCFRLGPDWLAAPLQHNIEEKNRTQF